MIKRPEIFALVLIVSTLALACGGGSRQTAAASRSAQSDQADSGPGRAGVAAPKTDTAKEGGLGRSVLYSLQPGENIMQAESVIAVSAQAESEAAAGAAADDAAGIVLVLSVGEGEAVRFFVVRDGKKTGPYPELEKAMAAAYEDRQSATGHKRDCATYTPGQPGEDARPVTNDAKGGQVIQFMGQSFGPFVLVYSAQATPDGARAYYTAGNKDKAWFGCSDGRQVSFGGIPTEFKFSPDGKNAAVLCEGSLSMAAMEDLSKLPPEKMSEAMQESDKKYLYTIDGQKFGPYAGSFDAYDFWYPSTANDLYFRVGDQVFRNGKVLFKADSFDRCSFYPSPDGQKYAMFTYESIVFSDGQKYPSPLDVAVFPRGDKTVFKWITLENNKDLVVYQRAM